MRFRRRFLAAGLALAAGGCEPGLIVDDTSSAGIGEDLAPRAFAASDEDFPNPERGLFTIGNLVSGYDFAGVRDDGSTVSYVLVRLDDHRAGPLSASLLEHLGEGFALARTAGVKILLRFAYNFESGGADAPRDVILGHLDQLGPVLHANADVIVAVQAGLIGAWGEWHSSSNGLDNPDDRRAIALALLAAVPTSRAVMLRSPMLKDENWPGPASAADVAGATAVGRLGHHNDCFLASESDKGTYADPVESWKRYVADDGDFLPIGGETCRAAAPRSECATAVAEMAMLHWSLLSRAGSDTVWSSWRADGCDAEIARRLGYRFRLVRAGLGEAVRPGGALDVAVVLHNDGFASPFNARPLFVLLEGGGGRFAAELAVDPRRWRAGEETSFAARVRLPADAAPGTYRVALWLPDAEPALRGRAAYSIRFANHDVWDEASGSNTLGTTVVDPAADATDGGGAIDLVALP